MADKELGALSPIETLLAASLFHIVQQGNSRKVTAQQIADFVNGNYPEFIQTLLSAQDADDVYAAIGAAPEAETAANAERFGGHLPSFFAAAQDVATAFEQLTKADVGLGNVDNTADLDKPVSTAQQTALDQKLTGPNGGVAAGDVVAFADSTGKSGRKAASDELRASTALGTGNLFGFRNVVINGGFTEWQRALSQTSSGYGSDDRWDNSHSGTTKTHSLQNFVLGQTAVPGEPAYFSRTVVSSIAGAGNYCQKLQRIEGVRTFAGRKVTLTFYAKADAPKNMFVEMAQDFGSGGSPSPFNQFKAQTIALTTTMTRYDIVADVPSLTGKVIGTNQNDNLRFGFWFDAGSDFNARTLNLGQQSGTFDIARVSLVDGDARNDPDPFSPRHPVIERTLCERYYQTVSVTSMTGVTYTSNGDTRAPIIPFKTRMRVAPSVTVNPSDLFVIAFGSGSDSVNVNIGNMTLSATADAIRVASVSNGGAMSGSGAVATWGDAGGRTFFANAEI